MDSGFFNMTKKNIIKYIIFVVYVTALFTCFSHIYAIDDSLNITENSKVSEETYNMITSVISDIKSDINEIDKKLENLKKNEIYINYPAVRLNVDTPVLG